MVTTSVHNNACPKIASNKMHAPQNLPVLEAAVSKHMAKQDS